MKVRVTIEADIELDYGETVTGLQAGLAVDPKHVAERLASAPLYVVRVAGHDTTTSHARPQNASSARVSELAARAAAAAKGRIDVV